MFLLNMDNYFSFDTNEYAYDGVGFMIHDIYLRLRRSFLATYEEFLNVFIRLGTPLTK